MPDPFAVVGDATLYRGTALEVLARLAVTGHSSEHAQAERVGQRRLGL